MADYVKNFSEAADIINVNSEGGGANQMMGFAQALQFRMQKAVTMQNTGNAIANMMKDIRRKRELKEQGIVEEAEKPIKLTTEPDDDFEIEKQHSVFNKSLEEETKTINSIAQDLLRKVKYQKIFKSHDLENANVPFNRGALASEDPRIKFF